MKIGKLTKIIPATLVAVAAVFGMTLFFVANSAQATTSADDIYSTSSSISDATYAFQTSVSDANSAEDVANAATALVSDVDKAITKYDSLKSQTSSSTESGHLDDLIDSLKNLSSSAQKLSADSSASDDAVNADLDNYDGALDAYNSAIDDYNSYLKSDSNDSTLAQTDADPQFIIWLVVLIVSAVIFVVALAVAFFTRKLQGSVVLGAKKSAKLITLKSIRLSLILSAGLLLIGAAIPFVQIWWLTAHEGGKYYVFFYPLVIGAIWFVISVVQYIVAVIKLKKTGGAIKTDDSVVTNVAIPQIGSKIRKRFNPLSLATTTKNNPRVCRDLW